MELSYREFGENTNISFIILHGLFGSSKNWITNAKELSVMGKVYSLDLRNHGDSPHSQEHNLESMVKDVREFVLTYRIEKPILIGHSMGGLVAMQYAFACPKDLESLVVVDIAPRQYSFDYANEFRALQIDVSKFQSRQKIDVEMAKILPDSFLRQFLQMNLEKSDNGYKWKINVDALSKAESLNISFFDKEYKGKALFIRGGESEYVTEEYIPLIQEKFPNASIQTIPSANHYLHYFYAKEFVQVVTDFVRSSG